MRSAKWAVLWTALILLLGMPAFAQDDNPSQGQYGGGGDRNNGDLDCADFESQAEAQATFAADPSDPNNLDADDDDEACEEFDYSQAAGGNGEDDNDITDARDADELQDLSCAELLVLFRGGGQGQYGNAIDLDDSEVRAQIEVCLEEEIVAGTGIDEALPDTGGLSLLALAVLGVVSAAAGMSVIRGGRR